MIKIKMLPARNGDALLITADRIGQCTAILVDGGYASTFGESIRPELASLAQGGHRLDLVVASHVDADHVTGLISFFQANGDAAAPNIIEVGEVWHNSLRSLTGHTASRATSNRADEEILANIRSRGFPVSPSAAPAEISARQGSSLAALLLRGGYRWNNGDGTKAICGVGHPTTEVSSDLRITVVGPSDARLDELRRWWMSEMRRLGYTGAIQPDEKFDDAFEFLSAHANFRTGLGSQEISHQIPGARSLAEVHLPDDSIINGSSIALIIEHQSHRILLLGDGWADDAVSSLLPFSPGGRPILFDAIKIAHHGSMRNTSPALLDLIDSPRYLICTNGERHNHPDVEVLKAIVDRPASFQRALYFNYATPASQFMKSYTSASGAGFVISEEAPEGIRIESPTQP